MNCPVCKKRNVTAGHILGHGKSAAKTASSRANAKLGGRPRKTERVARRANEKLCNVAVENPKPQD